MTDKEYIDECNRNLAKLGNLEMTDKLDTDIALLPDTSPYSEKVMGAARMVHSGEKIVPRTLKTSGRGRPRMVYGVKNITLSKDEHDEMQAILAKNNVLKPITQSEFETLAQMALPQLMHRAIVLAHESNSIKDVLAVAKEIGDRAFGKARQTVDITHSDRDIRTAWEQFEEYKEGAYRSAATNNGHIIEVDDEYDA